jgi:hypothetical protein
VTVIDGLLKDCSNSRRAKANIVNAAAGCAGAVGALLANGDRTALITVDTRSDTGSADVGLVIVDATGGVIAVVRAATGAAAAGGVTAALTTAGFGPVFAGAKPDSRRETAPPRCRAPVPGVSSIASLPGRPVEAVEDEPVVVLICVPPELLAADSPDGFNGRR